MHNNCALRTKILTEREQLEEDVRFEAHDGLQGQELHLSLVPFWADGRVGDVVDLPWWGG